MTLKILGQDPPEDSPPGDTVPSATLFWLSLLGGLLQSPLEGSCSPWSLSAALGTRAGCECVSRRDGRCTCCERGVLGAEGVNCPQSIVLW